GRTAGGAEAAFAARAVAQAHQRQSSHQGRIPLFRIRSDLRDRLTNFSGCELYLMEEEELDRMAVERCLRGDLDAFGSLIERYQRPVFNTVLHMVGDAEDAREVCQQAFMKAFEHLATYDRERKFFSWMYRVAVNESINHLQRRSAHEPP